MRTLVAGFVCLSLQGALVTGFVQLPCRIINNPAGWPHRPHISASGAPPRTRCMKLQPVGKRLSSALDKTPASESTKTTTPTTTPYSLNSTPSAAGESTVRESTAGESAAEVEDRFTVLLSSRIDSPAIDKPPEISAKSSLVLPLALLNGVTLLWGTQHAVIKLVLEADLSPGVTNFARFGLAALLFSPWTPGLLKNPPPLPFSSAADADDRGEISAALPEGAALTGQEIGCDSSCSDRGGGGRSSRAAETWRAGAELGVWMFLGFAFQAVGLGFTTASRSAFLLYLNVKLVPFFAFVLEGRSISTPTWISAFLAFVGTVLLSSDGTPLNVGDLWSILAAATSAMFILRLEKYSGSCDASQLNSANLWITTGLCGLWAAWEITTQGVNVDAALGGIRSQGVLIGYLAVVTTALTNWMQALGQRFVPAERAAVIYAMDPVYAAGFAYLLLGESLGPPGIVGAGIITGAALWSQGQQASGGEVESGGNADPAT